MGALRQQCELPKQARCDPGRLEHNAAPRNAPVRQVGLTSDEIESLLQATQNAPAVSGIRRKLDAALDDSTDTIFDNTRAVKEGWCATRGGIRSLQPHWSDQCASESVQKQALNGSAYHQRAMIYATEQTS